ncbi:hypothetical protein [Burkholderia glumae]|uniref:hypothetical protein n=1 Tax=Burkholderia glumae TaxID=337 RepID=UPI0001A4A501|nr:hypothetical protein [Burkholderia glumae]ACR32829.1 Hypothetical protein bglu_3p0540 [Burkholderia glumae BGR1]UVS82763.1 hypothetical protein EFP18_00290 [Burkholderia glumae]UVT05822.1 hypothetical protein EFP20_30125 [Burkholderia glumae]
MPRLKAPGKRARNPWSIKADPVTDAFYRAKAHEAGLSLSEYVRRYLAQGVLNDNVVQLEQRVLALMAAVQELVAKVSAPPAKPSSPQEGARPPSGVRLNKVQQAQLEAVFTSAEILGTIAHDRSPQVRDRAQDAARAKIRELTGGAHD